MILSGEEQGALVDEPLVPNIDLKGKKWDESISYRFHVLTKHTIESLMSGGHYLDWANQPNPFRSYADAPRVVMPTDLTCTTAGYFSVLESLVEGMMAHTDSTLPPSMPVSLEFLSNFLFYAMAISAWKEVKGTNNRWALRVNASSGNLHPTETHILVHSLSGISPGAYHYQVENHTLEKRAEGDHARRLWQLLKQSDSIDVPPVVICLCSIPWREVWKYRRRGFRYCQHDMGHALASCVVSAASLGWHSEAIALFPDEQVRGILELLGSDELPGVILGLTPLSDAKQPPEDLLENVTCKSFSTAANKLSVEEIEYPDVELIKQATCIGLSQWKEMVQRDQGFLKQRPETLVPLAEEIPLHYDRDHAASANDTSCHRIIRRRRSAVDFDGKQRMSKKDFATILTSSTRGPGSAGVPPASADLVDLFAYVHRVDDIAAGLYFFDRRKQAAVPLLFRDQREGIKMMSCFQDIAADGCFALSMIADLASAYQLYGDRGYKLAHYEAGYIGQLLYLAATALGYEATGIGCFVDDAINQYLALPAGQEVIYNFTFGRAMQDERLATRPSYDFPDPTG